MEKRSRFISFFSWIREKIPPFGWMLVIAAGVLMAFLLRDPLTSFITVGKSFDGRSDRSQIFLLIIYCVFFSALITLLYLSYFRFNCIRTFFDTILLPIKKFKKIQLALVFFLFIAVYYTVWRDFTKMDDTAIFRGDTWEYQSMAVNFAYGHGIQKFGAMEVFDTYKFAKWKVKPGYYDRFFQKAGMDNLFRPPAYPLFLGLIYKIFGVSPLIAKEIQLLLLVIIAAALPLIGYHYWDIKGLYAGIPAGVFYLILNHQLAPQIMTEALISFTVFLVLLAIMFYEKRSGLFSSFFLGISLGFGILLKGNLYLLAFLSAGWIILRFFQNHQKKEWFNLIVVIFSLILVNLPWSLYVKSVADNSRQFSAQGSILLLDDNNELCTDGAWHSEWQQDPNSFYNTDGIDNQHAVIKVINFYWHHPLLLPIFLFKKFIKGFGPFIFFWLIIGLAAARSLLRLSNRFIRSSDIRQFLEKTRMFIPSPFWIILLNFLLITLIFHGETGIGIIGSRFVAPMDFIFELSGCVYLVIFARPLLKIRLADSK